jgi:hypothetical protein
MSFENNKSLVENFKPKNHMACDKKDETMVNKNFVELIQRLQQVIKYHKGKNAMIAQKNS